MAANRPAGSTKLIVDPIHGDIRLRPREWRVVDTASFQRLRHLKQLQFGHMAYPGATHTRFAHSVGVLGIMARITEIARDVLALTDEQVEDIRLAGLLHDVGHYPYSHLMERVDRVTLTEEFLGLVPRPAPAGPLYPDHEALGAAILACQDDLTDVLGTDRTERIAGLMSRADPGDAQLGRLVHSGLDMDRLDYLLRDAMAAGVPFGRIDLNYLLHHVRASPAGEVGVPEKAITAVDHFLLGRFFMYRSVYYHKTTFGLEEACRHLLRRGRDAGRYNIPADGDAVRELACGPKLGTFTDAFVDRVIEDAAGDADPVVRALANSIRHRRPPRLLGEALVLERTGQRDHAGAAFLAACRDRLDRLADRAGVPPGRFLVAQTPPLTLVEGGATAGRDEILKVFVDDRPDPVSVVDVPHSVAHLCADHFFQASRLYLVPDDATDDALVARLRAEVKTW